MARPNSDLGWACDGPIKTADMPEDFQCACGNDACGNGFVPCDLWGREVEPVEGVWVLPLWRCNRCGQVWLERMKAEEV